MKPPNTTPTKTKICSGKDSSRKEPISQWDHMVAYPFTENSWFNWKETDVYIGLAPALFY